MYIGEVNGITCLKLLQKLLQIIKFEKELDNFFNIFNFYLKYDK